MPCDDDFVQLFGFRWVDSEAFSPTRQADSAVKASSRELVNRECNRDRPRRVLGRHSRTLVSRQSMLQLEQ